MAGKGPLSQRRFSDTQWRQDLQAMASSLKRIHPHPFHHISEAAFDREAAALAAAIPGGTDNEILVGLLRLAALTEDWHTQIISRNLTERWFPVRVALLQDGPFITAAAPAYAALLGAQVLGIGDRPIDAALAQVQAVTAHDNPFSQAYFAPMLLTMPSVLNGLHLIDGVETLPLQIRTPEGARRVAIAASAFDADDDLSWYWLKESAPAAECVTAATRTGPRARCWKNTTRPYWFDHLPEIDAAYLGFNMTVNDEREPFAHFLERMWRVIDHRHVERLVIDLRRNLGGDRDILPPLVEGILAREALDRRGGLFVLIGPKNVSASAHCAVWLERRSHPIFIGEPTGARPNQYADPEHVRLPHSGLRLMVSRVYWQNTAADDDRPCIAPHLPAAFSSADYFALRDPAMERVLAAIEAG